MKKEVYAIKKEDVERIRDYCKNNDMLIFLCLFNIGINVALRYSDLVALKFSSIKFNGEHYYIYIKEQKTKKYRKIILNDFVIKNINLLKEYYNEKGIDINKSEYLFINKNRSNLLHKNYRQISIQSVNRYFKKISKSLDIQYNIGTHSLRKTWGKICFEKYHDITILMKCFNHSSPIITLRYIGIEEETIAKIYLNISI